MGVSICHAVMLMKVYLSLKWLADSLPYVNPCLFVLSVMLRFGFTPIVCTIFTGHVATMYWLYYFCKQSCSTEGYFCQSLTSMYMFKTRNFPLPSRFQLSPLPLIFFQPL
ncbi:hypothetical protein BS78_K206100 [Paspalum vaginatum]|uniref:Uncharacterized protein n=1 Tax=Paspalum vaginatum TaxID=158149 RepID=A0A9W7XDH0_9POAL|nr:hypothetical protein BS78_K206100 [Paspalum vaginatum]